MCSGGRTRKPRHQPARTQSCTLRAASSRPAKRAGSSPGTRRRCRVRPRSASRQGFPERRPVIASVCVLDHRGEPESSAKDAGSATSQAAANPALRLVDRTRRAHRRPGARSAHTRRRQGLDRCVGLPPAVCGSVPPPGRSVPRRERRGIEVLRRRRAPSPRFCGRRGQRAATRRSRRRPSLLAGRASETGPIGG